MNKTSIALLTALIALGAFYFYHDHALKKQLSKCKEQKDSLTAKTGIDDGANNCNLCTDYSTVPRLNRLDAHMLLEMTEKYKNEMPNNQMADRKGNMELDARSVWFDIDSLKHFIWEIEKGACGKVCGDKKLKLGVRIYYARYPETGGASAYEDLQGLDDRYENRHTIFMIPTYHNSNSNEECDFDPLDNFDSKKCTWAPIDLTHDVTGVGGFIRLDQTAKNHGGLCPPVCSLPSSSLAFLKP